MKLFDINLSILQVVFVVQNIQCLRLNSFNIPETVWKGENALLSATYDLEGDQLYSVKYYKDGSEFFRFLPLSQPQAMAYPQMGVKVDMSLSKNGSVYVKDIQPGSYRVEVAGDAPSFEIVVREKKVQYGDSQSDTATKPAAKEPPVLKSALEKMEEIVGPKEEWPEDVRRYILTEAKEPANRLFKIVAFGWLNGVPPFVLDQVLRQSGASKGFFDSTSAIHALYDLYKFSKDVRQYVTSYLVSQQGDFNLNVEKTEPRTEFQKPNVSQNANESVKCPECKCEVKASGERITSPMERGFTNVFNNARDSIPKIPGFEIPSFNLP